MHFIVGGLNMEQKITVKIADKSYALKAQSPDDEEIIRKAAVHVNAKLTAYQNKFPGKGIADILSIVALYEGISYVSMQKKLEKLESELKELTESLSGYLENIAK